MLPQRAMEHHWRRPGREVSTNSSRQIGGGALPDPSTQRPGEQCDPLAGGVRERLRHADDWQDRRAGGVHRDWRRGPPREEVEQLDVA